MALCVVEINDCALRVARGGEIVLSSPGYAVLGDDTVEVGNAAYTKARLHPLDSHNRFWQQLNETPLQRTRAGIRHHGDLAYAHLSDLHALAGSPGEAVFVVPGSFSQQQLALLLGIAEAAGFKVSGLVDAAVAAAANLKLQGRCVHIDVQQHQAVLTRLELGDAVTRLSVETVEDAGMNRIYDRCSTVIADGFIKESRFDPLHHAATEQALYDQLGGWLQGLNEAAEIFIGIEHNQRRHEARLHRDDIVRVLNEIYEAITRRIGDEPLCLLSDRIARLPGFAAAAGSHHALPAEAVFRACQAQLLTIRKASGDAGIGYLTRLAAGAKTPPEPATPSPEEAAAPSGAVATHLMAGGNAVPLSDSPLFLSTYGGTETAQQASTPCSVALSNGRAVLQIADGHAVLVNGRPVRESQDLAIGDRIEFEDSHALFIPIEVAADRGS